METIAITESAAAESNVLYILSTLSELFSHAGCSTEYGVFEGRAKLTVTCPKQFKEIVLAEICDKAAEIVAVKYKYDFLKDELHISGLSAVETEILFAGLIAADLSEDKRYAFRRYSEASEITLDGTYNFRLAPLKRKWKDVVDYMPKVFIGTQLKEFISYMIEDRKKRVYVSGGKVYDAHYRVLKRRDLLGGEGAELTREVLLSGGGEVELSGKIESEDEFYLKEYFGDKIFFAPEARF